MSKTRNTVKTPPNESEPKPTVTKPRYTRVNKRFAVYSFLMLLGAIGFILTKDLISMAGAMTVCFAASKFALLYASPDGSVKSGRAGSVVYMRNGRRRNFVVPSLVQNDFTQQVRNRFGTNSNAWSGLTDLQRDGWNNAVGFTFVNRFGETKVLKGKALYVSLNQNLANIGATLIADVPLPDAIAGMDNMALDPSLVAGLSITYSPTPLSSNSTVLYFATAPLPAGFSRPSASRYRVIQSISGGAASPDLQLTVYTAKFGVPPLGSKVFFKAVLINIHTGQASPANIVSGIIVT